MNERIKELVKQSGGEFWQRLENDAVNPEAYITFDPPESLEKFAELIVRECMRMCDVAAIGYESHGHMKEANGCYSAKEYIEEHFGVGMSTEDKKTLIKELLGVNNETN